MPQLSSEQYQEFARLVYDRRVEFARTAMLLQADYSKWLVASLLLIYGGAFMFLAQGEEFGERILIVIHWWLFAGLMLAFITGLVTWINWGLHLHTIGEETSPSMIFDPADWTGDHKLDPWITATFYGSIVLGLLSAGCILGAAITASLVLG